MTNSISHQSHSIMRKLCTIAVWKIALLNKLSPLILLLIRFKIACIFWASGTLKLPDGFLGIGKGNWDSTILLFQEEYKVPLLSPEFAAYSGTLFEILCPILLVLGLGTRAASAILLIMVGVIEFTYQSNIEHQYWALLLGVLLCFGAGKISLDYLVKKKYQAS